jgi:hypothetical protein
MNFENFILNTFDGIANANYNLLGTLLALIAIIFWLVVISWIWVDAGERTTSKSMRIFYSLIGIIPIFGWIIYLIIRPSETIDEIYWGDLERRYLKYETAELGDCPKCGAQLFPGYIYCPNCKQELKIKCTQCGVYVDVDHKFCTHCGNQMRERVVKETLPDTNMMQEQIVANKEEAHESVKSKKSRYKSEVNFVTKIGDSVIKGYKLIGKKVSKLLEKKEVEAIEVPQENIKKENQNSNNNTNTQVNSNKKSKKKNKKKKKK